jgi:uncharacterized membrane protein YtjA (UPF0391 family)
VIVKRLGGIYPIGPDHGRQLFLGMFKKAQICGCLALLAALFGFTGLVEATAGLAQTAFYFFAAAGVVSCLFGLFECDCEAAPHQDVQELVKG